MWRPQYTVCVIVITGGQSPNKVEPSSVIVMLLSVYTHLTYIYIYMRMRRSASNETVNSGADDDVLPALISSSRRNLQQPRRLGYD